MTAFINILLSLSLLFGGVLSQADFVFHPEKYNAVTLEATDLPAPVTQPQADTFVRLSEVNMHYRVYGSGKAPLILVHGN
ncbi:MAG: hypothetical protein IKW76_00230, partial [Clostridia bacterium]|nr:hypothetical protein [Clostridia bacterium]